MASAACAPTPRFGCVRATGAELIFGRNDEAVAGNPCHGLASESDSARLVGEAVRGARADRDGGGGALEGVVVGAVGLLAGADEGLGLGEAALDGQRDEGRAGGRVADGDSGGSAVLLLVVGAVGDGAVEDAGHICHWSVLFNVAPWGLFVAGRGRVGRAVDSSDTPFRNMRKRSVFSLISQCLARDFGE